MFDDRHVKDVTADSFGKGAEGRAALKFTGSERIRLPLREWPMDTARIELELAPEDAAGKVRSVIHRKGHGAAFTLKQLGDNRLEAVWSGIGKGGVWKVETASRTAVTANVPLQPGRWTKVCLENDHRHIRILLDGRLSGEVPFSTFRCHGPVSIFLGGGEDGCAGYRGHLRSLRVGPCR